MSVTIKNQELRNLLLSFPGKAVKLLYDRYHQALLKIALALTHDKKVSEDIVQDTFVHIWENASVIGQPDDRSIQHYLVRIVRNKSISHYKSSLYLDKQKIKFINDNKINLTGPSTEAHFVQLEITQEIRDIIETFPRRERECLLMKIDEELNNDEISIRLKVSVKAVQRSLTSGKKRLRNFLRSKI